ncbi:hypothetical protein BDK51DRAFT_50724 [Blyttiomyces helicus]|uniref:Uncharacterized protein n=1 Tax=Blyttiomyces helicus TaxID=388810 RepID=A0A4P9VX06_9FUNG|nr:hypothetical protein BDK51DRAFT_50724 [Blyttiomyces helicus]|eukprot:RKO84251.1 hypothetical protein BDK51DRAFT_50724 [Blyttiomyces helicus]
MPLDQGGHEGLAGAAGKGADWLEHDLGQWGEADPGHADQGGTEVVEKGSAENVDEVAPPGEGVEGREDAAGQGREEGASPLAYRLMRDNGRFLGSTGYPPCAPLRNSSSIVRLTAIEKRGVCGLEGEKAEKEGVEGKEGRKRRALSEVGSALWRRKGLKPRRTDDWGAHSATSVAVFIGPLARRPRQTEPTRQMTPSQRELPVEGGRETGWEGWGQAGSGGAGAEKLGQAARSET